MEATVNQQGWKPKYSLKEYKANKQQLTKLAQALPSPIYKTKIKKVPGFELLTLGFQFWKNEPIIPWYEYPFTEHELVDHQEMIKNLFMDKGMKGLMNYVEKDIPTYLFIHKRAFPNLYKNNN